LGAVLYEMLSGSPPHVGATAQQIVRKILTDEPAPIGGLRKAVPPNVAAALAMALEKVPADRFESAKAFADALRTPSFRGPAPTAAVASARRGWLVTVLGTALGLVVGAIVGRVLAKAEPRPVARFAIPLPRSQGIFPGAGVNIAWTPDGSRIIYVGPSARGTQQLWQRRLDDLRVEPIAGTEGALIPVVSPNGASVAFTVSGALKIVGIQGGPPITLVAEGVPSAGGGLAWADDGRIYFVNRDGAIQSVLASGRGGPPTTVAAPPAGSAGYMWVEALPRGAGLVFTIARVGAPEAAEIVAVPLGGGPIHRLLKGTMARYARSGHLVFATAEGALMAAAFDPSRLTVEGSPVALFQGVDVYMGSASQFALSQNGDLLWLASRGRPREIVRLDRRGVGGTIDSAWTGAFDAVTLSPDGSRLAVTVNDPTGARIWIRQLEGGVLTPLSLEGSRNVGFSWSPDGRSLAILSNRSGAGELWIAPSDGAGAAPRPRFRGNVFSAWWTPDGRELVVARATPGAASELGTLRPSEDTIPRPLVAGSFLIQNPTISSDGRWLAYSSNETGHDEVFVQPFPDASRGKWQVSKGGGLEPIWAHSGRELFYRNAGGDLTVVDVKAMPSGALVTGAPRVLFATGIDNAVDARQFDVTRDDQYFIVARPVLTGESQLMMVQNFREELERAVRR
jgi:serine/threonine-protein kinase